MRSAELEADQFNTAAFLELICKNQHIYEEGERQKMEIDFLALDKEIKRVQGIQERTCEQIVEFVDQNRQKFIDINQHLSQIQSKVKRSQIILKQLGIKIDQYKSGYYLNESKIQRFINDYEMRLIQDQIVGLAKSQVSFLMQFNLQFERITNKQVGQLSLTQKYLISRFTYKLNYFKSLFGHQIVLDFVPETLHISEIVSNLGDQFQFYLSEQLAKYQIMRGRAKEGTEERKLVDILNQIKGWYMNLGKKQQYYRVLQKNTMEKEMQAGEKLLVANKTNLMSGKDQHILDNVFNKIFLSVHQFPDNYPKQRIRYLLFSFFRKEELKFLYTYAMPIFPLAFRSYLTALESSQMSEWLRVQLRDCHSWNLKMWVMVRQKNIMDRSNNDSDISKWIDIIFKNSCMLPGTLTDFLKLTFKLINRYLSKVNNADFSPSAFNRLIEQKSDIGRQVAQRIVENLANNEQFAEKVQLNISREYEKIIKELLHKNLHNVIGSCRNSLEPVKSFVSKIIKKDKEFMHHNTINKHQNLFKPLTAFLKNNAELSAEALTYITDAVEAQIVKYYDSNYATEIYSYSKDHLVSEQVSMVMEVVGRERTTIFKDNSQE